MKTKSLIGSLVCFAALGLAGNAAAVTYFNYTFNTGALAGSGGGGLTMTGVANTVGVDGYSQAYVTNSANAVAIANNLQPTGAAGYVAPDSQRLEAQSITYYSGGGLGIQNKDACPTSGLSSNSTTKAQQLVAMGCDQVEPSAPEHAVDNNQRYEMALLQFGSVVRLTALQIGYASGDSDMTVMAWMGAGAPTLLNGTTTWSTLGSGWKAVGNFANAAVNTDIALQSANGIYYSNYWLIGAYNPLANPGSGSNLNTGNDNFKLSKVTGCVDGSAGCPTVGGQVPEPGSLALLGTALLGVMAIRRRKEATR